MLLAVVFCTGRMPTVLVAGAIALPVLLLPTLEEGELAVKGVNSEGEGADDWAVQPRTSRATLSDKCRES